MMLGGNYGITIRVLNKLFVFGGMGLMIMHVFTFVLVIDKGLDPSLGKPEGILVVSSNWKNAVAQSKKNSSPDLVNLSTEQNKDTQQNIKESASSVTTSEQNNKAKAFSAFMNSEHVEVLAQNQKKNESNLPNFKKKKGNLEFVHITKTAGSAIERAAAKVGVHWGVCHLETRVKMGPGCERPDWEFRKKTGRLRTKRELFRQGIGEIELWHTPPSFFNQNPYQDSDTFTVVRNPYERIISEFYCPYFGLNSDFSSLTNSSIKDERNGLFRISEKFNVSQQLLNQSNVAQAMLYTTTKEKRKVPETPEALNDWILKKIEQRSKQRMPFRDVFMTAHMLPQHHYVFDENGNRTIDHVLKYEMLHQHFPILMDVYNQSILLPTNQKEFTNSGEDRRNRLNIEDLSPEAIGAINSFFQEDFLKLGYDMISNQT